MTILNFIRYRNPLGHYVEDFITDSELRYLINRGLVLPFDYHIRGNFWHDFNPSSALRIEFVYKVHYR